MTTLRNMKFKIDSPEQSERLQKVLFSLGYKWTTGGVQETGKPHLYAYASGLLLQGSCDRHFESKVFPEQGTEAFIVTHTDKMVTMHFRDSEEGEAAFKGLESAWDSGSGSIVLEPQGCSWFDNDGTKPDLPKDTLVEILFSDKSVWAGNIAECMQYEFDEVDNVSGGFAILQWRFHKPEDAEGYEQPKTVQEGWGNSGAKIYLASSPNDNIDAHYNFTYHLTQDDVDNGFIKIDPYFVSQQWQLGSKDSTGVIFHLLKTIARFGDKNGKDREINALYKSTIRLAQLEGVELK